ncbi:MAG: MFS transporter [Fuerstiella sp.]|nr:MFS transporter [Fuerstiella sp.]
MTATRVRFQLSVWLAIAAALAYACRVSISVAEKEIRADLGISEDAMGFILGPAFFWSYALAQIPGGWLGQRFGSRRTLPGLATVWSAATILMCCASGPVLLLIGRVLGGIAQAGLFPCSALCISRWYPQVERARASGFLGAAMSVGAAVSVAMTGQLLGTFSWRWIFAAFAAPGVLWAVGFFRWFRETPDTHPAVSEEEKQWIRHQPDADAQLSAPPEPSSDSRAYAEIDNTDSPYAAPSHQEPAVAEDSTAVSWVELFLTPAMWLICSQQFFRAAGYAFFTSWFATYLQETRGVSTAQSGWLLAVPLIATVAAALIGGTVSDWLFRTTGKLNVARSGFAAVSLLTCTSLVCAAFFVEDATTATVIIGAGAFCAGVAGPCAYATTMDWGGAHVAPVFSTMNMVGNFGAGLLPWFVPTFRRWIDSNPSLLQLSADNSWNAVLILFAAMYLLAAFSWMLLRLDRPFEAPES